MHRCNVQPSETCSSRAGGHGTAVEPRSPRKQQWGRKRSVAQQLCSWEGLWERCAREGRVVWKVGACGSGEGGSPRQFGGRGRKVVRTALSWEQNRALHATWWFWPALFAAVQAMSGGNVWRRLLTCKVSFPSRSTHSKRFSFPRPWPARSRIVVEATLSERAVPATQLLAAADEAPLAEVLVAGISARLRFAFSGPPGLVWVTQQCARRFLRLPHASGRSRAIACFAGWHVCSGVLDTDRGRQNHRLFLCEPMHAYIRRAAFTKWTSACANRRAKRAGSHRAHGLHVLLCALTSLQWSAVRGVRLQLRTPRKFEQCATS